MSKQFVNILGFEKGVDILGEYETRFTREEWERLTPEQYELVVRQMISDFVLHGDFKIYWTEKNDPGNEQ